MSASLKIQMYRSSFPIAHQSFHTYAYLSPIKIITVFELIQHAIGKTTPLSKVYDELNKY